MIRIQGRVFPIATLMRYTAIAVLGFVGAVAFPVWSQQVGVAARVNGHEISVFRLERYFEEFLKGRQRSIVTMRRPEMVKAFKREALDQLIDRELLADEAARRHLEISDELLNDAAVRFAKQFKSRDAYLHSLSEAGFDEPSFREYLRRSLAAEAAMRAMVSESPLPSDNEVKEIYTANRASFAHPEQVRARHILIKVPKDASPADREAAKKKILKWRDEIVAGADFADIAKQRSEDASAPRGGDLGYFARGQMVAPFGDAAFAAKPGEISGPVETVFGWHLIRVEEHRPAGEIPEAEALAQIRQRLILQRRPKLELAAREKLRATAKVEILLPL